MADQASRVAENDSNSLSLPGWIVGLKTRMITAVSLLG
jgi:hypothetical protein